MFQVSVTAKRRLLDTRRLLGRLVSRHSSTRHGFLTKPPQVWTLAAAVVGSGQLSWRSSSSAEISGTRCEAAPKVAGTTLVSDPTTVTSSRSWQRLRQKVRKAWRLWARCVKLFVVLTPLAALYPIQWWLSSNAAAAAQLEEPKSKEQKTQNAHELVLSLTREAPGGALGWYYKLCLYCTEWSGAAVVKLMQWAGSRPDLFGRDFCAVFSQLQDSTTPHAWKHTERALRQAYGEDWKNRIQLGPVIGSGCIGQVYKGVVKDSRGQEQQVAVKVLHPNVQEDIDSDLDLMRLAVRFVQRIHSLESLKWLNLEGTVEEFARLLNLQLDLRHEAANLQRFHKNFVNDAHVVFPQLIPGYPPSRQVLVETFCDGVPILSFARAHRDDPELLRRLCLVGIRSVCQMIFLDNFMHGDLHPGNVLVHPEDHTFMVLDVGMVSEYSDANHRAIVDILAAFIRKDGRKAGRLLIDDSNVRLPGGNHAQQEELYIDKIEALCLKASGKGYLMEHLGTYISYICEAAATHHVMLNEAFVSVALAVKILEGIALALDPSIEIPKVATPIILKSEVRRRALDAARRVQDSVMGSRS